MTEEIIKECEFYLPLSANCNEILDSNGNEVYKCLSRQDCYYKQLKRAEIEIEKLKGVDGSVHPDSAYYKITRLEQENKELKELIGKTRYNRLEMYESFGTECNKYRSALEEIREIADDTFKVCDDDCGNARKIKLIIDKINEVLK